ncbi:hypothetical protein FACS1894137_08360 [Spirochaetia bacterium]|nr:hypothetical protein FACS1894137_08360 [Spirochaetia bacterium]
MIVLWIFCIIGIIVGVILFIYGIDCEEGKFIFSGIVIFIFCVVFPTISSFFWYPYKENRYVPYTRIAVSRDYAAAGGENPANLPVDETVYLQIRISVQSNSWARRFLHDNKIPVTVTVSGSDIAEFHLQNSRNFVETKPLEMSDNVTSYFFYVYAADLKKLEERGEPVDAYTAIITLRGTALTAGEQTVRVKYDDKISVKHTRVETLVYQ